MILKNKKNPKGFMAIVSLLIITGVSMIFAMSMLRDGMYNTRSSLNSIYYESAKTNSKTCLEDIMMRIKLENQFMGPVSYSMAENNSCSGAISWSAPTIISGTAEKPLITETPAVITITGGSRNNFSRTFVHQITVVRFDAYSEEGEAAKQYINQIKINSIEEIIGEEDPNQPPVMTNPGNQSAQEGDTINFTLIANDPENDTITYSMDIDPVPANMPTLDSDTGVFNWNTAAGNENVYTVIFTATSLGGNDSKVITIDISSTPATCNGALYGGYCWYAGDEYESCGNVCSDHGGYNQATATFAGNGSSNNANCEAVLDALNLGSGSVSTWIFFDMGGVGCHRYKSFLDMRKQDKTTPTTENAGENNIYRACACNE